MFALQKSVSLLCALNLFFGTFFCKRVQIPYSRKYWRSIKFGGLAVGETTVKFKSVKFKCDLRTYVLFYACACAHIICMELPPNLNPPIFLFRPLGTKPPNLKIANISGYTVVCHVHLTDHDLSSSNQFT